MKEIFSDVFTLVPLCPQHDGKIGLVQVAAKAQVPPNPPLKNRDCRAEFIDESLGTSFVVCLRDT